MSDTNPDGRRPERPQDELTEQALTYLMGRDMPAEVSRLLSKGTHDAVDEARQRTRDVEWDLEARTPFPRWTPEVFFLYAENAMARARVESSVYGATLEQPMVAKQYQNARETAVELLDVITNPEQTHRTWSDRSQAEVFPAVMAAIEDPERKRAATARAFNLVAETAVIQEAFSSHGSRWVKDMEGFHGMFAEWKDELAAAVELTTEEEDLMDQRLTLLAMITKGRSVIGEVAPELQRVLVETLPQRGPYPEDFLPKIRDILAERMRGVVSAADELQAIQV